MKRFALIASLIAFALTPAAIAKEKKQEKQEARANAAAAKAATRNPGKARQFAAAQRPQRSFTNVSRQSSFQGQQLRRSGGFNPDVSIQPRRNRSFTPRIASIPPAPPTANVPPVIVANTVPQFDPAAGRRGNNDGINARLGRNRDWRNGGNFSGSNNPGRNWRNNDNNDNDGRGRNRNGRNWQERHENWHNNHAGDANFSQAHRRWHRGHQNRDWWRSRYSRFALFGGGYYYWNSGYWYPAYGYDPYFSTYSYDAPIYGYNDLEPGQVIANVQAELQQRGYNPGGVDGQYGPMTRRALLNYQRDNGLPVSGEIDESTLDSLGLQ